MTRGLILLLLLVLANGPAVAATEESYDASADRVVGDYILPSLAGLRAATTRLAPAAEAYCASPSPASQEALRGVFGDVLAQWARLDFLRFGPVAQDQRLERFAFWPDSSGAGARQLRRLMAGRDPAYLDAKRLSRASAAIQGLPAFEALMFPSEPAPPDAYACGIAAAIAANLTRLAEEMERGWTGPGGWENLAPKERMNELLKALLTGLVQLRDQRLIPALGKDLASARPERLPYRRSACTDRYVHATVNALADFSRALDLPRLAGPDLGWASSSLNFEYANIINGLNGAGSLSTAITTPAGRAAIDRALVAIKGVQDLTGVQLAPAAGLSVGFNALDGD